MMKAIMRDKSELLYSEYSWMGSLPINWNTPSLLYVLRSKISDGPHETPEYVENGIPFISIDSLNETKNISLKDCKRYITEEDYIRFSQKTRIEKDDILFSKAATIGKTAIIKDEKIMVWSPLAIIKANPNIINNEYLYHVLNCDRLIMDVSLSGSMNTQINVGMRELEHVKVPLPPFEEQQTIANYLDDRCSKIDDIIAEAKASIEEYKELKQAVIYEAVTKGLNKSEEMHITNNMWIPELPNNVKLSRLGLHYTVILGKMLCPQPRTSDDTLEPYICAANVHFDGISGDYKKMWFNCAEKKTYSVHCNDMLVVEGGAGAGGATIVDEEPLTQTFIQNSIMIVRAKDCDDNRYVKYLIEALVKRNYVDFVCNKATIPHFTKEKVSTIPYPVFSIEQRTKISDYLDDKTSKIDEIISEKQSLIEDLESYKKSLIYEVVTGKRKVVES